MVVFFLNFVHLKMLIFYTAVHKLNEDMELIMSRKCLVLVKEGGDGRLTSVASIAGGGGDGGEGRSN